MSDTSQPDSSLETLPEERLSAYLAEYNALRNEIDWLIRDGSQYQSLAVKLIGVVFGAAAWIIHQVPQLLLPLVLVVPFVFCTLGFLFSRQHEEVHIVARYIKDYIRPRVRGLVNDSEVWGWEEFKSSAMKEKERRARVPLVATSKVVHSMRMLVFLFPAIVSLTVVALTFIPDMEAVRTTYGPGMFWLFALTAIADSMVFIAYVVYLLTLSDLPKRTGLHNLQKGRDE